MYQYKYPRPAMTADCAIFGFDGRKLYLLLIERGLEPYKGYWALPGGFMHIDETIKQCALRELQEETGLENVYVKEFGVFSRVDRDPRGRVVTVAFLALVSSSQRRLVAGDDAAAAHWFAIDELPPLAFDHEEICNRAEEVLKAELRHSLVAFHLLDEHFSMTELHTLAQWAAGKPLDRRNFERKIMSQGLLEEAAPASCVSEECEVMRSCSAKPISPRLRKRTFSLKQSLKDLFTYAAEDDLEEEDDEERKTKNSTKPDTDDEITMF